jgi:hypothetical protein
MGRDLRLAATIAGTTEEFLQTKCRAIYFHKQRGLGLFMDV